MFFALLLLCSLLATVLAFPAAIHADQAQYFYDELGRLVGVVDSAGNAAVYVYDEVGNLLRIDCFTAGETGIGIFLIAPNKALVETNVEIKGFGFIASPPSANQVTLNGPVAARGSAPGRDRVGGPSDQPSVRGKSRATENHPYRQEVSMS